MIIIVALLLINVFLLDYALYTYYKAAQKKAKELEKLVGGDLFETRKNIGNDRNNNE